MNEIEAILNSKITTNSNRVNFGQPYGVYLKQGIQNADKTFELNWLYDLILFFIHSNETRSIVTTTKDVLNFFESSRIFYLQKDPAPERQKIEVIIIELLYKLANNGCIAFQKTIL